MSVFHKMDFSIATIILTGSFLVLILLLFILRNKIPCRVNCWFCNESFWMPFGQRNSWNCKKCEQYNGFNSDGNYNKRIDMRTPKTVNYIKNQQYLHGNSNGLCRKCNSNQQLKIMQLASFVPMNEKNFNSEVEAYKVHLEKVYQLCSMCRRFLKEKLSMEKRLHLNTKLSSERLKQKNEIKVFDVLLLKLKLVLDSLLKIITITLMIIIIFDIIIHLDSFLSKQVIFTTKKYFYSLYLSFTAKLNQSQILEKTINILHLNDVIDINLVKEQFWNKTTEYQKYVKIEPAILYNLPLMMYGLSIVGLSLQILRHLIDFNVSYKHVFKSLLWTFIIYNASTNIRYLDILQMFLVMILLLISKSDQQKVKIIKNKGNLKSLSYNPMENDDEDLDQSDSDDDYFECHKFNNAFNKPTHSPGFISPTTMRDNNKNFSLLYGWNIGNTPNNIQMPRPTVMNMSEPTWKNNLELDKSISDLSLGKLKKNNKEDYFVFSTRQYTCSSPNLFMPSPTPRNRFIISPSRLINGAQQSWVAGGYWGAESPRKLYNSRNESSSSSQSSGFESFTSNYCRNMNSFPPSREDSVCSEYEISKLFNNSVQSFQSTPFNNSKQNEPSRASCVPYNNFINRETVFNNRFNSDNSFIPLQRPTSADVNKSLFS